MKVARFVSILRAQSVLATPQAFWVAVVGIVMATTMVWVRHRMAGVGAAFDPDRDPVRMLPLFFVPMFALTVGSVALVPWIGRFLPRAFPVEVTLPVSGRELFGAKFVASLVFISLAYLGGFLVLVPAVLLFEGSYDVLGLLVGSFGASWIGLSLAHIVLGRSAVAGWWRFAGVMAAFVIPLVGVIVLGSEGAPWLLAGAPLATGWAWARLPDRLVEPSSSVEADREPRRRRGGSRSAPGSAAVPARERVVEASAGAGVDLRSRGGDRGMLAEVARHVAWRNPLYWLFAFLAFMLCLGSFVNDGMRVWLLIWFGNAATWAPIWTQVLRPFNHLPLASRAPLFRIVGIQVVLAPMLGAFVGSVVIDDPDDADRYPRHVVLDTERRTDIEGYFSYLDVQVPNEMWRLWIGGGAPHIRAPWGETVAAKTKNLPGGLSVWNPYQLSGSCSLRFGAWQLARALNDVHGIDADESLITERILEVEERGGVDFRHEKPNGERLFLDTTLEEHFGKLVPKSGKLAADALVFLLVIALYGVVVLVVLRPRQLPTHVRGFKTPAAKIFGGVFLCLAVLIAVIFFGDRGAGRIAIDVVLDRVLTVVPLPAPILVALGPAAIVGLWVAARRRFERIELPRMQPGFDVQRMLAGRIFSINRPK